MLKKIIFSFVALIMIIFGFSILTMGYIYNHPEKIFSAFDFISAKVLEGKPYHESQEYFLQGMKKITLISGDTDIQILPYDQESLKLNLDGALTRFENGHLIQQEGDPSHLILKLTEPLQSSWFQFNVNGHRFSTNTDNKFKAVLYLPKKYLGELEIKTEQGRVDVQLPPQVFYEFDLHSENGKISDNITSGNLGVVSGVVGKMKITTESGDITITTAP